MKVLITTAFIRDCIVEEEKTHLIPGAIAQGTSEYGMQTFDQWIFSLLEQELISYQEALRWASKRGRVQAESAGHLDNHRHGARSNGACRKRPRA